MAPEPEGYSGKLSSSLPIRGGQYLDAMHEYVLMYDDVRRAKSPRAEILEFAQNTYAAGADLAGWDRSALER